LSNGDDNQTGSSAIPPADPAGSTGGSSGPVNPVPPQDGAAAPPQGGAAAPPQGGAAAPPPQGGAAAPPQGGAAVPPQGGAAAPPQGGAAAPPGNPTIPVVAVDGGDSGKTVVEKDLSGEAAPPLEPPPGTKSFNLEERQERIRGRIAQALIVLLYLIVLPSFFYLWWYKSLGDLKPLLELILAPIVALVGTATGFYFGGRGKT
jgi:hypothetical protein